MKLPQVPWSKILKVVGLAAVAGVLIILVSAITQWRPLADVGGLLLAPGLLLAGGACVLVVLAAPIWPISAIAEKVPRWARWPFAGLTVVATLAWWAIWVAIAAGGHSGF